MRVHRFQTRGNGAARLTDEGQGAFQRQQQTQQMLQQAQTARATPLAQPQDATQVNNSLGQKFLRKVRGQ